MTKLAVGVQLSDSQLAHTAADGFGQVPELLDDAGIGYVLVGADRGSAATASLSPVLVGTVFARRTRRLGVVPAASPQRDHPYNIARRTASLDHISGGRAGWLALHTDRTIELGTPAHGSWAPPATTSQAFALADAITAARALWGTWPFESLLLDTPAARPANAEVCYADHTGIFPTTGPLNVPSTPQGQPIVFWNYRPGDGQSASVADVAVITAQEYRSATEQLPTNVTAHVRIDGRHPELMAVVDALASDSSTIVGVLIELDLADLPGFVKHTVPELSRASCIRTTSATETLRQYLRIASRDAPETRCSRTVFAPK